jgi:arylformamidase
MRIYDLSRPIAKGEPVYPGNPAPVLKRVKNFKRDKSNLSELKLGPTHYLKTGRSIDQIDLLKCVGWARVVNMESIKSEIGEREIKRINPKDGEIILFKTKNSSLSRRPKKFDKAFIHITNSAARALVKSGVKAVGIDGPSIRKFRLKPDTVHPTFLKAGILIYEGLDLKGVKTGRYYFIGLPLRIKNAEASPVRAVLIV